MHPADAAPQLEVLVDSPLWAQAEAAQGLMRRALAADACKVEFEIAYEFATHVLETVVGPVFSHIANTLIDAFVHRAEAVYATGR